MSTNSNFSLPYVSVQDWFEDQVRLTPDAIAVVFEDTEARKLTFSELNRRANQLARRLEKSGAGPEQIVAICLERSLDLIVGLLAILKSGSAYLPVDPALPRDRQTMMLEDARPALVLTETALQAALPMVTAPFFVLDKERAGIQTESGENAAGRVRGKNLAYVMYTSGSTGVPKGVEIPHEALVNFLVSMKEQPGLTPKDILIAVTTLSFDIAGLELFLPLVTGARLVLLNRDDSADGFRIVHHLIKHQATVLQATPSTWRMLLDASWVGSPNLKMLCGGEALQRDLADRLLAGGGELWNMYGPTETTIWSACGRVESDGTPITIGHPIAHTQLYVLDAHLQPVPMGVSGELHIGGLGLARGYRNRPELTAERFIPDPFSDIYGARLYKTGDEARHREPEEIARLYKTGDVARLRAKGQIEILGRLDHQVKIRGFRIELGEIESRLSQHPAIKQVVVVAREDVPGRKQLVAYIVPKAESSIPGANAHIIAGLIPELRRFVEEKLPDYMVPSFFEELPAFPLTPNGKINRKALPVPKTAAIVPDRPYVAPRNEIETKLAEIWAQVLNRHQVGVEDNIFEIGGDSLLIFRIAARAKEATLPFTVRQFFQYRTIAELAAQAEVGGLSSSGKLPSLTAVSRAAFRRPNPNAGPDQRVTSSP